MDVCSEKEKCRAAGLSLYVVSSSDDAQFHILIIKSRSAGLSGFLFRCNVNLSLALSFHHQ